jgi:HK97 gp10 family phage protein
MTTRKHQVSFGQTLPALKSLKRSIVNKHLRRAVTIAARPITKDAKSEAQAVKRFGFLSKAMGSKIRTYAATGTIVAVIGARSDKKFTRGVYSRGARKNQPRQVFPAVYLHFLEAGTSRSKKRPVVGAAFEKNKATFRQRVAKEFWPAVEKELKGNT